MIDLAHNAQDGSLWIPGTLCFQLWKVGGSGDTLSLAIMSVVLIEEGPGMHVIMKCLHLQGWDNKPRLRACEEKKLVLCHKLEKVIVPENNIKHWVNLPPKQAFQVTFTAASHQVSSVFTYSLRYTFLLFTLIDKPIWKNVYYISNMCQIEMCWPMINEKDTVSDIY